VYVQATKTGTRERPIPQHPDLDVSILPVEYGLSWLEKWIGRAGARAAKRWFSNSTRSISGFSWFKAIANLTGTARIASYSRARQVHRLGAPTV
jgi:hypothetical protein